MKFFKNQAVAAAKVRKADIALISASDLFDREWYLERNSDVAGSKLGAVTDFLRYGASKMRAPGPEFDIAFYLSSYADVAESGLNPLVHYLKHGEREGRLRQKAMPVASRGADVDKTLGVLPLFSASNFEQLSTKDSAAITRHLAHAATPAELLARVDSTLYSPIVSLLISTYNTPPRFFRKMLQSIFSQTYTNWEICLVDDGSTLPPTIAICDELRLSADPRVKILRLDEHLGGAGALRAALTLATGDYLGFIDHYDMLTENALSEIVDCLRNESTVDFIYTDHVEIDADGQPRLFSYKPIWSPELFKSTNYIGDFGIVRRDILRLDERSELKMDIKSILLSACDVPCAKAKVKYLEKSIYLRRETNLSESIYTTANCEIQKSINRDYNNTPGAFCLSARQSLPVEFQGSQRGLVELDFGSTLGRTALILLRRKTDDKLDVIFRRFAPLLTSSVVLHVVTLGDGDGPIIGTAIKNDREMLAFVSSLDADIVAFSTATSQYLGIDWLARLSNYVKIAEDVGAAGGKVLDPWLQVRSGGMLLDAAGEYHTIGGGCFDSERAHLNIGQIASNVDAVSSQLMATRRVTLLELGGINFHAFGDAAGVAYSANLVSRGYRIVYDPYSRHCDAGEFIVPSTAFRAIRELGRNVASLRRYKSLGAEGSEFIAGRNIAEFPSPK